MTAEDSTDPGWAWAAYEPDARRPWTLRPGRDICTDARLSEPTGEQLQQSLADGPQRTVDRLLRPDADIEAFNRTYGGYENVGGRLGQCTAGVVAAADDRDAAPAAGEDDALLAQSFRHRRRNGEQPSADAAHVDFCAVTPLALSRLAACDLRATRPCSPGWARTQIAGPHPTRASPGRCWRPSLWARDTSPRTMSAKRPGRSPAGSCCENSFAIFAQEHDDTTKHVLGREGNFTGDDVVRIVLGEPATSRTLVRKLYRWLISETRGAW